MQQLDALLAFDTEYIIIIAPMHTVRLVELYLVDEGLYIWNILR